MVLTHILAPERLRKEDNELTWNLIASIVNSGTIMVQNQNKGPGRWVGLVCQMLVLQS